MEAEKKQPRLKQESILRYLELHPGQTTEELATAFDLPVTLIYQRIYHMITRPRPVIKRIKQGDATRIYLAEVTDPLASHQGTPLTVLGTTFTAHKLSAVEAEALGTTDRARPESKYAEVIKALDELEIGEALALPRANVGRDRLRTMIVKMFTDRKTFATVHREIYLVVTRTK